MKIFKAFFGALLYLATFVVIPRMAVEKMPVEMTAQFGSQEALLSTLTTFGILLAALYVFKTLTPKGNPANLLSRILLDFLELYIFLFFIGLGDAASLGRVEKQVMAAKATVLFNFRIFAQLMLAAFVLKMVASIMEFKEARDAEKLVKKLVV